MSRIQKYQDSIEKFFYNKLCLIYLNEKEAVELTNLIKNNLFIITIFLFLVSNNINKKNKVFQHSYYIGGLIELLNILIDKTNTTINTNYKNIDNDIYIKITNLINILLMQNLEMSSINMTKDKLIKNYCNLIKTANIISINALNNNNLTIAYNKFTETDLMYYKFKNIKDVSQILGNYNKINSDDIIKYIENNYYPSIEYALSIVWICSGEKEEMNSVIKKLGYYFSFLLRINRDILDFENILENMRDTDMQYSKNIVINLGIQETFEWFIYYKKKFIELSLKLKLFSNNINDLIEFLENTLDNFINNTTPFIDSKNINFLS